LTWTFKPSRAMVMTHTHANGQGQNSVGLNERVVTYGPADGGNYITSHASAVSKNPKSTKVLCHVPDMDTLMILSSTL